MLYVMYLLASLLSSASIDYRLVYNVCESDTSAGRPKVPFYFNESHIIETKCEQRIMACKFSFVML